MPNIIMTTFKTAFVTPTERIGNMVERTTENPETPPAAISCCMRKKYKPTDINKAPIKIHMYFFIYPPLYM